MSAPWSASACIALRAPLAIAGASERGAEAEPAACASGNSRQRAFIRGARIGRRGRATAARRRRTGARKTSAADRVSRRSPAARMLQCLLVAAAAATSTRPSRRRASTKCGSIGERARAAASSARRQCVCGDVDTANQQAVRQRRDRDVVLDARRPERLLRQASPNRTLRIIRHDLPGARRNA